MQLAEIAPEPFVFDRAQFLRLVDLGTFRGHHVQLVNGVIIRMSPAGAFHHSTVWKLDDALRRCFGRRAMVRAQMAFAANSRSRPEPDIAVVPAGDSDAEDPTEAFLVVEVADSSLAFDRTVKASLYADAGIPEYWIVDLNDRQVEVRTKPVGGRYTRSEVFSPGESLAVPRTTKRLRVVDFLTTRRAS
ncbi:MAG: Uma2 family endonuclease [Myxococcaceae bacterium]|jgi:Uma2 family endonuclease|nr:Uma2 family endonuclease [Myxococcaceae bacterium]